MQPEYTSIMALASTGETKDVTPWATLAALLVLLGAHGVWSLSRRVRTEPNEGRKPSWARSMGAAIRLAVTWALAAGVAVLVSFPAGESESSGAAGALLLILGGLVFGSYAFALALVTLVGFFRLRPEGDGAPWLRHALITGLMVSVTWLVMCPSPILLTGEAEPSAPHLAGLLAGVILYSLAVVTAVFWRARQPPPVGKSGAGTA
jgi:hypothetical protein